MDFVIHELLKDVNDPVRDRYRNSVIAPTAEETSFVSEVRRLFKRHHSGRIYGNFESDTKKYPFSQMLREYQSEPDFLVFSKRAAEHLAKKMGGITVATGGYFFAARFVEGTEILTHPLAHVELTLGSDSSMYFQSQSILRGDRAA